MKSTLILSAIVSCAVLLASANADPLPLGQQLASYSEKDTTQEGKLCYNAVYNRLKHVFDKNKKTLPELGAEEGLSKFSLLWRSSVEKADAWKKLDKTYKACGPPGAMVDAGLATLVDHKAIWEGKLKPGAVVQVWNSKPGRQKEGGVSVYNSLLAGKVVKESEFFGQAFIFLRYVRDKEGKITGMRIADQGTGWDKIDVVETTFGLWIGANLND